MKLEGKSLKSDFIRFMLPSVLAQWVFALYTMVDGMFVARGVSEVALSAVNIAMPFVNFLFGMSLLFAVGSSTVIAIMLGQKKLQDANRTYTQNTVVLLVLSLIITAAVLFNLDAISHFLGATPETLGYVKEYIATIASFSCFFMLVYSFEIMVKVDGMPRLSTIAVVVGAVANCILDYVFVFIIKWGVFGAAFATGLSQVLVMLIYLGYFFSKRASLKFTRFRFNWPLLLRTIRIGVPSGVTELSVGLVVFLFNHAILRYIGQDAIVSYTIIAYVNTIVIMSMAGITQGFQPLVSYYYGKGSTATCTKLLKYGMVAGMALSVAFVAFSLLFADTVVALFISPQMEALRQYSAGVFRIFSISFLLLAVNIIASGYFTAIERPKSAFAISLARGFVTLVISLYLLITLVGGEGIWWAATLSEGLCLVATVFLFYRYQKAAKLQIHASSQARANS